MTLDVVQKSDKDFVTKLLRWWRSFKCDQFLVWGLRFKPLVLTNIKLGWMTIDRMNGLERTSKDVETSPTRRQHKSLVRMEDCKRLRRRRVETILYHRERKFY